MKKNWDYNREMLSLLQEMTEKDVAKTVEFARKLIYQSEMKK